MIKRSFDELQNFIIEQVVAHSRINRSSISLDRPFAEYNIDSITATTISGALSDFVEQDLSPTLFWDYPCINAICRFLLAKEIVSTNDLTDTKVKLNDAIAVIGIGCHFPGASEPLPFWNLLAKGDGAIGLPPLHPYRGLRPGGYLSSVDMFDAGYFDIPPQEAALMDPQQRLFLEVAIEALTDAGIPAENLAQTNTSVFVGMSSQDYSHRRMLKHDITIFNIMGNVSCITANRLSYLLDLRGPSMVVDTACSSSLTALHLACQSLKCGESSLAIVGGVNLLLEPQITKALAEAGMLSKDNLCKTLDSKADGYVRSEGVATIVLKPMQQALDDGDRIYAQILSSAINQDGKSNGLTAPNPQAQIKLIQTACNKAGIKPSQLQYIELHGTGTELGDPIEVNALTEIFSSCSSKFDCRIGSVKSNIGHLEACAGLAGIIKVCLAIYNKELPPTLHLEKLNPRINLTQSSLKPQTLLSPWPNPNEPLLAGISSFSFGGSNAHVIISSKPLNAQKQTSDDLVTTKNLFFLFSAHTESALLNSLKSYQKFLENNHKISLYQLACNLCFRRSQQKERLVLHAASIEELQFRITSYLSGERDFPYSRGKINLSPKKIAFVFSGQGNQLKNMAKDWLVHEPRFQEMMLACDSALQQFTSWSILDILENSEESLLADTAYMQPVLCAIQISLTALLESWGIVPQAVIGHSMGEIAAAQVAGFLSLTEAMALAYQRGKCLKDFFGKGAMAIVNLDSVSLAELIKNYNLQVVIAAYNSPSWQVISGLNGDFEQALNILHDQHICFKKLRFDYPFHGPWLESIASSWSVELANSECQRNIKFYSTVTTEQERHLSLRYWLDNIKKPVLFHQTIEKIIQDDFTQFVEIAPFNVLDSFLFDIQNSKKELNLKIVSCTLPNVSEEIAIRQAVADLYVSGNKIDWSMFFPYRDQHCDLPNQAWDHCRYWEDAAINETLSIGAVVENEKLLLPIDDSKNYSLNEKILTICRVLFNNPDITIEDDFLRLNGNSLMAMQLATRLKEELEIQVSLSVIFTHTKISNFISKITDILSHDIEQKVKEF